MIYIFFQNLSFLTIFYFLFSYEAPIENQDLLCGTCLAIVDEFIQTKAYREIVKSRFFGINSKKNTITESDSSIIKKLFSICDSLLSYGFILTSKNKKLLVRKKNLNGHVLRGFQFLNISSDDAKSLCIDMLNSDYHELLTVFREINTDLYLRLCDEFYHYCNTIQLVDFFVIKENLFYEKIKSNNKQPIVEESDGNIENTRKNEKSEKNRTIEHGVGFYENENGGFNVFIGETKEKKPIEL